MGAEEINARADEYLEMKITKRCGIPHCGREVAGKSGLCVAHLNDSYHDVLMGAFSKMKINL